MMCKYKDIIAAGKGNALIFTNLYKAELKKQKSAQKSLHKTK